MAAIIILQVLVHLTFAEHFEDRLLKEDCAVPSEANCTSCNTGDYLKDKACYACPSSCSACTSGTSCTECNDYYYLDSNKCLNCQTGCSTCTSSSNCSECIESYYLSEDKCSKCPDLCLSCNSTECFQCANNTYIKDENCELCYESELSALIIGPTYYSTTCKSLKYSASNSIYNSSQSVEFFWQLQQIDDEDNVIWAENFTELSINPEVVQINSTLKVKLLLSICEQESSAELSTEVRTGKGVNLNPGFNTVTVLSGTELVLSTEVTSMCGLSGSVSWAWEGKIKSFDELLIIKDLPVGVYNESVIVKVSDTLTYYNFSIESSENQLVSILSRSSGVASIHEDFTIDASESYILDNFTLLYEWTCYNFTSKKSCQNETGFNLEKTKTSSLFLSKKTLISEGIIKFTVTLTAGTQKKTQSVEILFGDYNENVYASQTTYRYNKENINYIEAQGETNGSVLWNSTDSVSLPYPTILSLWIPSKTLTSALTYTFNLLVNEIEYAKVNFYINNPPECLKTFTVNKISADFGETIKISQPECEDSDLPLTYNLNYSTPDYFQVNSNIILPVDPSSTLLLVICDSLKVCTKQKKDIKVTYEQLSSDELTKIYNGLKSDKDLVPLIITAFGRSVSLPSSLYKSMLADLSSYQKSFANSQIAVLNALSALTSSVQTDKLLADNYKALVSMLNNVDSVHFNSDLQVSYTLQVNSNLARLKSATSLESSTYIKSAKSLTSKYLPGQSLSVSNSDFSFFKYTHLGSNFPGFKYQIDGRNITLPSVLPFDSSDLINFYFTVYKNKANYSDYTEITFTKSGDINNSTLTHIEEKTISLSKLAKPIIVTLKYRINVNNKWACAYLKDSEWLSSGCTFLKNDSGLIQFSTNHTSLFSVFDTSEVKLPPVQYIPTSSGCGKNLNGIWILVVITFLFIIFLPIIWWADKYDKKELASNNAYDNVKKSDSEPSVGSPSFSEEMPSNNNLSSDYAVQYKPKPKEIRKHWCKVLIEGHLLFGILVYRTEFNRVLRLMTLCTVLIFELLLEGLLMMGFETTDEGSSGSAETYFNDYKDKFFGYTIFALVINLALEISLVILFSLKGKMRRFGLAAGYALIIICLIGSIAGIIIMALKFCPNWSGYWGISFLFGTIVEVILVQTMIMGFRVLLLKCLA